MKKKTIIRVSVTALILLSTLHLCLSRGHHCPRCAEVRPYVDNQARLSGINTGIDWYKKDMGLYPDPVYGLTNLIESCGEEHWSGPYIIESFAHLTDHWGNKFQYEIINGIPIVISAGPDGRMNTYDDYEANRCRVDYKNIKSEPVK